MFQKFEKSVINSRLFNNYRIFDIRNDIGLGADFSNLTALIRKSLREGKKKIAIRFTQNSYLYTHTFAALVNYYKMIDEQRGKLCIIEPNESIMELMKLMGLASVVEIVSCEKDVGTPLAS